jgi:PIN domain nuclease of toxin-antitoxin system
MVVLDTCALLMLAIEECPLSQKTLKLIEEKAVVLTISFIEIACKVKIGKLILPLTPIEFYEEIKETQNIEIIEVSISDWFNAIELEWADNKDPVDRLITAYAIKHNISIVTSDTKIRKFYKKVIW